jgi:hypothetical protein
MTTKPRRDRSTELDAADIARLLAARTEDLVAKLLPGGKRRGRWFRAGSVNGETGASLVVELTGPYRGKWRDYAGDPEARGDLLDLIAWTQGHRDPKKTFEWARAYLGLETGKPLTAAQAAAIKQRTAERMARARAAAERQAAGNRDRAERIWQQARPLEPGDPVDRYLEGRGIALSLLARAPAALRYMPSLWYGPGRRFPAMVAAITDGHGEFCALHRTWLQPRPDGGIGKAAVDEPKKTLGNYRGGSIKLWRGRSGKPWLNMPMGSTVVLSEGVEDALSALVGAEIDFPARRGRPAPPAVPISELRVIAAVSGDNIAALDLPSQVARLVILQQRDPPGSPAAVKLDAAITRFEEQGIEVLLLPPPAWAGIKDLNDVMRTLRPKVEFG